MTLDRTKPPPFFTPIGNYCVADDIIDRDFWIRTLSVAEAWAWYDRIILPGCIAALRELADELSEEAYRDEPESQDPMMEASREGYQEGLKWAAKKLRWRVDALERKL